MAQTPIIDRLDNIRTLVRQCPTSVLIRAYALAAREWCDRTRWLTTTITGETEADTKRYGLGDDPHVEVFGIAAMSQRQGSGRWEPVTELNSGSWDPNADAGEPEKYQYVPHAAFSLYPTPDAVYDLRITAVIKPKVGVNSLEEVLLTEWDLGLEAGALYRLLRIPDQPWTNPAESSSQYLLFQDAIARGCSSVFAGRNPGAAVADQPGHPNAQVRQRPLAI